MAASDLGLSKLSVWWLRLGIGIERIKPGNPQQNGRHERMHLTLKKEATRPAGKNFLQQQSKFDDFMQEYNHERPHQALGMKYPAELYSPSTRLYRGLSEPKYPFHDRTVLVTHCGRICIGKRKISLSRVFAGQWVGIREIEEKIWLVSFMNYDLGFFDHETGRVECAENPFQAKVLPNPCYSLERARATPGDEAVIGWMRASLSADRSRLRFRGAVRSCRLGSPTWYSPSRCIYECLWAEICSGQRALQAFGRNKSSLQAQVMAIRTARQARRAESRHGPR